MGKYSRTRTVKKKKKSIADPQNISNSSEPFNFLPEAAVGCHICHYNATWTLGVEEFDPEDYDSGTEFPDIAVSPSAPHSLCVINPHPQARTFYISLPHTCRGRGGHLLAPGWTRDDQGDISWCVTLILVVSGHTLLKVCEVEVPAGEGPETVHERMDSDVQPLLLHPDPHSFNPEHAFLFPLSGEGSFLCTQGTGGSLTHFFAGSLHAVDFRCPVGTPLVAVGDGTVLEVRQIETVSGVHVSNLFKWNSIMLRLKQGVIVEYVHIKQGSSTVQVGDVVTEGQKICESGDVGFCPEPHLHFQMHLSQDEDAPTLKFALKAQDGSSYFPEAGKYYCANGLAFTAISLQNDS